MKIFKSIVVLSALFIGQTFATDGHGPSNNISDNCKREAKFIAAVPYEKEDLNRRYFPLYTKELREDSEKMKAKYQFASARRNRLSAAVQLPIAEGSGVRAIYDGVVEKVDHWYMGMKYIQIKQNDGLIVRYASIKEPAVKVGDEVYAGDFLAIVDAVKVKFNDSMVTAYKPSLSLEFFAGTRQGPLTQRKRERCFNRRSDLLNPTEFVNNLLD